MSQAMSIQITCDDCGRARAIVAANAGETIPCLCGKQLKVPKLSDLRRIGGEPTTFVSITDQLRTMYLDKQLPLDTHCISCQVKTADTLECWVECERARTHASGAGPTVVKTLLLNAILPFFGWFYVPPLRIGSSQDAEVYGNDVVVRTPLPICENCLHTTSRSQANIRRLLQSVELYRQLLNAYPGARVGAS